MSDLKKKPSAAEMAAQLEQVHKRILSDDSVAAINGESGEFLTGAEGLLRMIHLVKDQKPDWSADDTANETLNANQGSDTVDSDGQSRPFVPQTIGRFKIYELIGRGGFGLVFRGFDPNLNRDVAVKIPRLDALMSDSARDRFVRETRAAAALSHPQIVTVFESGRFGPVCFLACELINGPTLAEWLHERDKPLQPRTAVSLVRALADAVQHAHNRGIIHRDIKPENILLAAAGESVDENELPGVARIGDFGLAKFVETEQSNTQSGSLMGTPAWMSPEQVHADVGQVGPAADVHALGLLLYRMLTNQNPFQREQILATFSAVQNTRPPSASVINRNVSRDLDAIVNKCLEKKPDDRYCSAHDLRRDLDRMLKGHPVLARPLSRRDRGVRWAKRNPVIATLSSTILALILVLTAGSTVAAVKLFQANQDSLDSLEREITARDKATKNETLALRTLHEARIQQSRAIRLSGRSGQRIESLAAIRAALKHKERLELAEPDLFVLRNEVIASLALVDLGLDQFWPGIPPLWSEKSGLDPLMQRYGRMEADGQVVIRSLATNDELIRISTIGTMAKRPMIRFGHDGTHLAIQESGDAKHPRLQLWDLENLAEPLLETQTAGANERNTVEFSQDGRYLLFVGEDEHIKFIDINRGEIARSFNPGFRPDWIQLSPDGSRLATLDPDKPSTVQLVETRTGQILKTSLPHPDHIYTCAWNRDGRLLAAGGAINEVYVWDPQSGKQVSICRGHRGKIMKVDFANHEDVLLSTSWDKTTRLWDPSTGKMLLRGDQIAHGFGDDDKQVGILNSGVSVGRWNYESNSVLSHWSACSRPRFAYQMAWSPDGRHLAYASAQDGVFVRDLESGSNVIRIETPARNVQFAADGKSLFVGGFDSGIQQWPLKISDDSSISMSEPIRHFTHSYDKSNLSLSADQRIAVLNLDWNETAVIDLQNQKRLQTLIAEDHRFHSVSPDGKWVASGSWRGTGVRIWNVETGDLTKEISIPGYCRVVFSADGQWLVTCSADKYEFWSVAGWEKRHAVAAGGTLYSNAAFTDDGKMMAVALPQGALLLDPATGRQLAILTQPDSVTIRSLAFSPDRTRLAVGTLDGSIHLWQLDAIRNELGQWGLAWPKSAKTRNTQH